jgi:hypothetical protein
MKETRIKKLALALMGPCLLIVVGAVLVGTVWLLMVVGSLAGVSPAFAQTPSAGGLQATVNGLCSSCMPSISVWSISEDVAPGDPIASSCDWFTNNGPPGVRRE